MTSPGRGGAWQLRQQRRASCSGLAASELAAGDGKLGFLEGSLARRPGKNRDTASCKAQAGWPDNREPLARNGLGRKGFYLQPRVQGVIQRGASCAGGPRGGSRGGSRPPGAMGARLPCLSFHAPSRNRPRSGRSTPIGAPAPPRLLIPHHFSSRPVNTSTNNLELRKSEK